MLKILKEKLQKKSVEVLFSFWPSVFFAPLVCLSLRHQLWTSKIILLKNVFFRIIAFRKCQKAESVLTFVKIGYHSSPSAQSSTFSCMFYWKAFYLYKALPLKTLWFHFLRKIFDRSVMRQKMPYVLKSLRKKLFVSPQLRARFLPSKL